MSSQFLSRAVEGVQDRTVGGAVVTLACLGTIALLLLGARRRRERVATTRRRIRVASRSSEKNTRPTIQARCCPFGRRSRCRPRRRRDPVDGSRDDPPIDPVDGSGTGPPPRQAHRKQTVENAGEVGAFFTPPIVHHLGVDDGDGSIGGHFVVPDRMTIDAKATFAHLKCDDLELSIESARGLKDAVDRIEFRPALPAELAGWADPDADPALACTMDGRLKVGKVAAHISVGLTRESAPAGAGPAATLQAMFPGARILGAAAARPFSGAVGRARSRGARRRRRVRLRGTRRRRAIAEGCGAAAARARLVRGAAATRTLITRGSSAVPPRLER